MSITKLPPNKIWLGGPGTEIGDTPAGEAITPGYLIERYNSGTTMLFRKQTTASATAAGSTYACEQSMVNKGVDDGYAINDLVEAVVAGKGANIWAFIASGQTIVNGDRLESAGDGTLRKFTSGLEIARALEAKTALALTRIRVEVV